MLLSVNVVHLPFGIQVPVRNYLEQRLDVGDQLSPQCVYFDAEYGVRDVPNAGAEYRAEYLRALQHARPTYFVVSTEDLSKTAVPNDLQSFPELLTFVMQNYRLEQAFGGVTLYRRRDDVMAGDQPAAGPVGASAAAEER